MSFGALAGISGDSRGPMTEKKCYEMMLAAISGVGGVHARKDKEVSA